MKRKKFFSKMISFVVCMSLLIGLNINASALEMRASDTVSRGYSSTFHYSKSAISADQNISVSDIPTAYKKVEFDVILKSTMQFDRITGSYVSAETPTATLSYVGTVPLQMTNISTSKRDNGSSVTFSYSADVVATVDTGYLVVKISYGKISDSYTVNK